LGCGWPQIKRIKSPIRASNNMQLSSLSRILGMGADAETQQLQHVIIGSGPITSASVLLEALPHADRLKH